MRQILSLNPPWSDAFVRAVQFVLFVKHRPRDVCVSCLNEPDSCNKVSTVFVFMTQNPHSRNILQYYLKQDISGTLNLPDSSWETNTKGMK